MGKRGPKKGQGGRPRGGKHSEAQRHEWRLRKIKSKRKTAERKQLENKVETLKLNAHKDKLVFASEVVSRHDERTQKFVGVSFPVSAIEEQQQRRGIATATDSVAVRGATPLSRYAMMGIDEDDLYSCMIRKMDEGMSEDDARDQCEKELEGTKQTPKVVASDSHLGIVGREATEMEKCIGLRQDIYGEDLETATRTCSLMFNDETYRHVFAEGDAAEIGRAFFKWEYDHSPDWKASRERDAIDRSNMEKGISKIIDELTHDPKSEFYRLPGICAKDEAEKLYRIRQETKERKLRQDTLNEKLTVGNLQGKTKAQTIIEQQGDNKTNRLTVGSLYGKNHKEIITDIQADNETEEALRKLRRREKRSKQKR